MTLKRLLLAEAILNHVFLKKSSSLTWGFSRLSSQLHSPISTTTETPSRLVYHLATAQDYVHILSQYQQAFERHPMYYLQPLDIEGNPTFSWVLPQASGPSASFRRSRSKEARDAMRDQGRSRVPLPAELQPKTGNGKTVEDYTREINNLPHFGLSENLVLDVVEELEAEQRHKCLSEEWTGSSSNGTEPTPATTTDNDSTTHNDSSAVGSDADEPASNSRSHSKDSSNTASVFSTDDFNSLIESTSTSTTTFTSYLEVVPECEAESNRGRRSRSRSVSVSIGSPVRLRLRSCSSSADLPPRKTDNELFFGNQDNDNRNNDNHDKAEEPSISVLDSNIIESKFPSVSN